MTDFDVTVELFIDGAWLDVTRLDDDTHVVGDITIQRGGNEQQGEPVPTQANFRYLDNNLTLDGENPLSPYYRKIAVPGTPIRIKRDGNTRVVLEIVKMPIIPGDTTAENYIEVEAADLLRRYGDGQKPLRSSAYRAFMSEVNDPYRVAYWPVEEESGATSITSPTLGASASLGGPADIDFGAGSSMSSARLAQFGSFNTFLTFVIPTWTNTLGQHLAGSLVKIPEDGLFDNAIIWRFYFTGGDIDYVDLLHNTGTILTLVFYAGGAVVSSIAAADWSSILVNKEAFLFCTFHQNGANIDARVRGTTSRSWLLESSGTVATRTLGRMYQMVMGTGSGTDGLQFGHVIVGSNKDAFGNFVDDSDISSSYLVTGARGYDLETAGSRMTRLADEENVPFTLVGVEDDTERLSAQTADTFLELIRTASAVDLGILHATRDVLEIAYRTRTNLYNQPPTAQLDFIHLQPGFRPTSDDVRVVNDVTVSRSAGSSAQYAIPDGDPWHWTTEDPPDGVGIRDDGPTIAAGEDSQLSVQSAWRAHLGSWREKRFSGVTFELAKTEKGTFTAAEEDAILALDLGDVMTFDTTNAPAYVPYDEIRQMVQGYTEVLGRKIHTITFSTVPADIYEVAQVDASGSTAAAIVSSGSSALTMTPPTVGPAWTESSNDIPYHLQVNGDPMTVTAILTNTPAHIATGTAAYADNASVVPSMPAGITPDVGQLLLLWIATRTLGATPGTPTGWTTITYQTAGLLLGRFYRTGDAAPTCTVSGGSAGVTVGAQIAAFSGLSMTLDLNTQVSGSNAGVSGQTNGSAQNIAYPTQTGRRLSSGLFIFGRKDDDWTGVAPPAGFTEIGDSSSTLGNDMGLAWYFKATAATAPTTTSGSLTVTGGASAASASMTVALRALQTATVTRGIAGLATSHSIGDPVNGWRMGVTGL